MDFTIKIGLNLRFSEDRKRQGSIKGQLPPAIFIPDSQEIAEIGARLAASIKKTVSERMPRVSLDKLRDLITALNPQQIYNAYWTIYGRELPRYLHGDSGDLAVSLRQAMLDSLGEKHSH